MKVALYLRYSSEKQTEQSIEGQDRVCTEYCERNGYKIVQKYIDRAASASHLNKKRVQFMQMLQDSDKAEWDAVVVYKLDRFARERYQFAIFKQHLIKNKKKLISATEAISDQPEGIILEALLEGMAEYYSAELRQKVVRGQTESAHKSLSLGGTRPLGYRTVNKRYVIVEEEANIVREAFRMYVDGVDIKTICDTFNNKGYKSSTGAKFTKGSFHTMFRNEKYIGVYTYKDIRNENAIPPIVDRELFDAARRKLEGNQQVKSRWKAVEPYLLSGKVFCGHCGSLMYGDRGHSHTDKIFYYYVCSGRKKGRGCTKRAVPKDFLEQTVFDEVLRVLTPEMIDKLADVAVQENRRMIAESPLTGLKQQLATINKKMDQYLEFAIAHPEIEDMPKKIAELQEQRTYLQDQIEDGEKGLFVLEKDHVVWFLSSFIRDSEEDIVFKQKLIDMLVTKVIVWDDDPDGTLKIRICFNLVENGEKIVDLPDDFDEDSPQGTVVPPKVSERKCVIYTYFLLLTLRKHP